ncbi:toxin-antitoxin system YwqK family antitoxin [Janthinobacterium sp. hw3]|uniref:Toxin-antitoxin system YwqK family antitoxin n=2 Tax=Janthinobacterium fluminis TaxID=2987524 RepID=A0ABT5K7N3_9BURK|nr:toxin-antitoxin system YwqK family antitoxin [Janthinobacterium fluminis]
MFLRLLRACRNSATLALAMLSPAMAYAGPPAALPSQAQTLYLDEDYAPTERDRASYLLRQPLPRDEARQAWHAQLYNVQAPGRLHLDVYVKSPEFSAGEYVHMRKTYYDDGQLAVQIALDGNGVRDGESLHYHPNGQLAERETFRAGVAEGAYTTFHENGQLLSVREFRAGKLADGEYLSYHANGKINSRSRFRGGQLHGVYEVFYGDGQLYQSGPFADGARHGPLVSYWPDGRLQSSQAYVRNRLDGWSLRYHQDGKLARKTLYRADIMLSEEVWGEDGKPLRRGQWDEQQRAQGEFREWFPGGEPVSILFYLDGQLHGPLRIWHYTGVLKETAHFVHGKMHGPQHIWGKDGSLRAICHWRDGERFGACQTE